MLGVSEGKMRGNGMKSVEGVTCVYSGVQEGRAKAGVAIYVTEELGVYIKEWKCISERMVLVKLRIREEWLCFVQVYAPTEDSSVEEKEEFFSTLQETVSGLQCKDRVIILGDFNARVGNRRGEWREVNGGCGEETCNDNGRRLLEFCASNGMIISNTWYQHKEIHQFTWECRGRGLKSIIDYFLVKRGERSTVRDTKVVRGAEISSDHYLVLLVMKRFRREARQKDPVVQNTSKWNVKKLREMKCRKEFERKITQKFLASMHSQGSSVELAWEELKGAVVEVATEMCRVSRRKRGIKRTKWWNEEVQKAVVAKKVAYRKMLEVETDESRQRYVEAKREAKRVVRRAKNEEWNDLGRELEADAQGGQKRFWSRLRSLGDRGRGEVCSRVKDEDGLIVGEGELVVDRWKRYFTGLYEGEGEEVESSRVREGSGEEIEEIEMEEMVRELRKMKNGKSPGVCGIQVELLKAGGLSLMKWMQMVFNLVMKCGKAPRDWRRAVIIPIYKKGCRLTCSNYRGISLLSVAGKWFGKVLNTRLRESTEGRVMEEQGGFRAKRSCVDQVFTLRQVMEKVIEKRREIFVAFIDLEKAYDRVNRMKMWEALRQAQVGEGLVRAVKSLYIECEARVKVGEKHSEWFKVDQGVRQGCTLSPWLFNVFLDNIVKEARKGFKEGMRLGNETVDVLLFADDMVLVADSEESLQVNLKKLDETLTKWEMKMNWEKTEVMKVGRERGHCCVAVGDRKLESVEVAKYLGIMISGDGRIEEEIRSRIGKAAKVIGVLNEPVWKQKELSRKTKMKVYNAIVVPTLVYGSETWVLNKHQESAIQATEMRVLRRIAGKRRVDRARNVDIREELRQEGVLEKVRRRQVSWREALAEMGPERLVRRVYEAEMEGRRGRGRPRKKWIDNFKQ